MTATYDVDILNAFTHYDRLRHTDDEIRPRRDVAIAFVEGVVSACHDIRDRYGDDISLTKEIRSLTEYIRQHDPLVNGCRSSGKYGKRFVSKGVLEMNAAQPVKVAIEHPFERTPVVQILIQCPDRVEWAVDNAFLQCILLDSELVALNEKTRGTKLRGWARYLGTGIEIYDNRLKRQLNLKTLARSTGWFWDASDLDTIETNDRSDPKEAVRAST